MKREVTTLPDGKQMTTEIYSEANSIELSRNVKGQYSWTIKTYGNDLEEVLKKVKTAQEELLKTYSTN